MKMQPLGCQLGFIKARACAIHRPSTLKIGHVLLQSLAQNAQGAGIEHIAALVRLVFQNPVVKQKYCPPLVHTQKWRAWFCLLFCLCQPCARFHKPHKLCQLGKRHIGAQKLVEEITDSVSRNPGALISLARLKTADDYTYMHSVAVCALMIALARQLDLDEELTQRLGIAGLLHDLGKALMPMDVLNKPGKLTDEEFAIIKTHPEEGYKLLLASTGADDIALDVVLHHHEKTDGSGYPKRLKNEEISLHAKMGAVCDVYDAITSNRPYKAGWDPAESLRRMAEWSNGHFDPTVFQAFVKSLGIYPIGSLVKLKSGRLGLVVEQSKKSLLTPCIKVFYSTRSNARIKPEIIDLSRPGCSDKIAGREDPSKWNFPDLNELWSGLPGNPW